MKLTDEEKEAIEYLKEDLDDARELGVDEAVGEDYLYNSIEKVLNLIEKQKQEIAQLRTELNSKDKLINCLIKELQEYLYDNKITKEQIIENVLKEWGKDA